MYKFYSVQIFLVTMLLLLYTLTTWFYERIEKSHWTLKHTKTHINQIEGLFGIRCIRGFRNNSGIYKYIYILLRPSTSFQLEGAIFGASTRWDKIGSLGQKFFCVFYFIFVVKGNIFFDCTSSTYCCQIHLHDWISHHFISVPGILGSSIDNWKS